MKISKSSEKILQVFFRQPGQNLYINELIRETGMFPNSVQRALLTLEKEKILLKMKKQRFVYYRLNLNYSYINELKTIVSEDTIKKDSPIWVKILNRKASYSFFEALYKSNMINLKTNYGVGIENFWYNDITLGSYYHQGDLKSLGEAVSLAIEKDLTFAKEDIKNCRETCDVLVKKSQGISSLGLTLMSSKELVERLESFYEHYLSVFPFVTVPHAIERFFESKIRENIENSSDYEILSSPTNTLDDEQEEAFKLADYVKRNGFDKEYQRKLTKHYLSYCWMSLWSLDSKPLSRDYFDEEVRNILSKIDNPKEEIKKLKLENKERELAKEKTLKKIEASKSLRDHIRLLQEYIFLRTYRKNAICQANFNILPLIYEVGNRLKLSNDEVILLSYPELIGGLKKSSSQEKLKKEIEERKQGWAVLVRNKRLITITGAKNIIETMERYQIVSPSTSMQRSIKGRIACKGKVTGTVKVVTKLSELSEVKEGDVLVAKMTTPDYMIAIHKVVAMVTDDGGITCHAAIVSREFNIPCITGTRNATQVLSNGDIVEVDANLGIVRMVENINLPEDVKDIHGKTIYNGKVRGIARIVLDASDFSKVKENDILIAPQTTPEYLSLLYKVKGFVVDEEAITSHAVLYGNALQIPSIMGTKYARNIIQDGDRVELNATEGILKRL